MKKIVLTMVAALAAVSMNAQVYVGGSFGLASFDNGNKSQTAFAGLYGIIVIIDIVIAFAAVIVTALFFRLRSGAF